MTLRTRDMYYFKFFSFRIYTLATEFVRLSVCFVNAYYESQKDKPIDVFQAKLEDAQYKFSASSNSSTRVQNLLNLYRYIQSSTISLLLLFEHYLLLFVPLIE